MRGQWYLRAAAILTLGAVAGACADRLSTAPRVDRDAQSSQSARAFSSVSPVSFTLTSDADGGSCGLATTVSAQGTSHFVLRLDATGAPSGFTYNASGTAAGADGSTYAWNDAAIAGSFEDGFFNEGWSFDIVDHFTLVGQGTSIHVRAFVHGRLIEDADGEFVPDGDVTITGPECDPDLPLGK